MRIDIASQILIFDWKKQKTNVRFRVTADSSFVAKDNDGSAVIVDASPSIFREVDVTIADVLINGVTTTQVTVPAMWLFSTNDVLKGKRIARYSCSLVDKQGTLLQTLDSLQTIQVPVETIADATPTTWTEIIQFNSPAAPEPINRETFSREQILELLAVAKLNIRGADGSPSFSRTSFLEFDEADGFVISQTVPGVVRIDFTGGGGGGTTINPTDNFVPFRQNSTTFADSSISSGTNKATQFAITARSSGAPTHAFRFITPADTGLTASIESPSNQFGGDASLASVTRQWAAGALATQRENVFVHPTYGFTGASTLTSAATLAITNAPQPGTNATINNAYALWVQAGVTRLGGQVGVNSNPDGAQLHVVSDADGTNGFILQGTAAANSDLMQIQRGVGLIKFRVSPFGDIEINPSASTSGSPIPLNILAPANTNMSNSEKSDIQFQLGRTVTFQGGGAAIALQRAFFITNPTYAASAAQTITRAATVYISGAPIAGSNITLTETLAFLVDAGNSKFGGRVGVNVPSGTLPGAMIDARSSGDNVTPLAIRGTDTPVTDLFTVRRGAGGTNFLIDLLGRTLVSPTGTTGTAGLAFQVVSPEHSDLNNVEQNLISFNMSPPLNFLGGGAAIALQRSLFIDAPTINADAAQTITTAATFVVLKAPVASTNITITNPLSVLIESGNVRFGMPSTNQPELQFTASGNANITSILSGDSPASSVRYKLPADNPAATEQLTVTSFSGGVAVLEWAAAGGGGTPAGATGDYQINNGGSFGVGVIVQGTNGRIIASPTLTSSGALSYFRIVTPADTTQTADTEMPGIVFGGNASGATVTRQGADGVTVALQREYRFVEPTYGFAGATTITESAAVEFIAPVAGTNCSFTRNSAILINQNSIQSNRGIHVRNLDHGDALVIASRDSGGQDRLMIRRGRIDTFEGEYQINNTFGSGAFSIGTGNVTGRVFVDSSGQAGFNKTTSITAQVHVVSGSTSRIGLKIDQAANSSVEAFQINGNVDDTSTVAPIAFFKTNSNGTPANNFGQELRFTLESSTTADRDAASIQVSWSTAADATRTSAISFGTVLNGGALTNSVIIDQAGLNILGNVTGTAAFRVFSAVNTSTSVVDVFGIADDTATVAPMVVWQMDSNGTVADGFGQRHEFQLESTTTNGMFAAAMDVSWTTATHASRVSNISFSAVDNAVTSEVMALRGNGQIRYYGLKVQTGDVTRTSSTVFTDLTGLTFNVVAGRIYQIRVAIYFQIPAGTGDHGGAKITLAGTATMSTMLGEGFATDNVTGNYVNTSAFSLIALGGNWVAVPSQAASINGVMYGTATISVSTSGNVRMQGAQVVSDADGVTFNALSTMEIWEISNA